MPIPLTTLTNASGASETYLTTLGLNQVPYVEFTKYEESFATDAVTSTRHVACLWSQRQLFLRDMLGRSLHVSKSVAGQTSNISRYPPEQHPDLPWLTCTSARLAQPMGAVPSTTAANLANIARIKSASFTPGASQRDSSTNMVAFSLAYYTLTYTQLDYDLYLDENVPNGGTYASQGELGRYVSRYYKPSAEFLPIPGGVFRWVGTTVYINEPPPKLFPTWDLQWVWHQVPLNPNSPAFSTFQDTIKSSIGKVNNAAFDAGHGNYLTGTLLCLPPDIKRVPTPAGDIAWEVTYMFQYRENAVAGVAKGHNWLYRPSSGAFEEVTRDGTTSTAAGNHIFDYVDFNGLFKLPTPS